MAIRSRLRSSRLGTPASGARLPSNFGQTDNGVGAFATGVAAVAGILGERKDKEDTVTAKNKVAEFSIAQHTSLTTMAIEGTTKKGVPERIDEAFNKQFDEASQYLLESAESDVERDHIANALPALKQNMVISAMKAELQRNAAQSAFKIDDLTDTTANTLLSSLDPLGELEGHMKELDESILANNHLDNTTLDEKRNAARTLLTQAALQKAVRDDWRKGQEALNSGKYDEDLTPAGKLKLMNEIKTYQNKEAADEQSRFKQQVTAAKAMIPAAEKEIARGAEPGAILDHMESILEGTPDDVSGELRQRIGYLREYRKATKTYAGLPAVQRQYEVDRLEKRQLEGKLSVEEIEMLGFMRKVETSMADMNYSDAVRLGISPNVPLNAQTIGSREIEARKSHAAWGNQASVFTPPEKEEMIKGWKEGDTASRIALMDMFTAAPTMRRELMDALFKENTPAALRTQVASDLVQSKNFQAATLVLEGDMMLKTGSKPVDSVIMDEVAKEVWGPLFFARGSVSNTFKHAAIAHYLASTQQSSNDGKPAVGTAELAASSTELKASMEAVLPAQLAQIYEGDGGTVLTPSLKISQDQFIAAIRDLQESEDWWKAAKWYDPATGDLEPLAEAPTYLTTDPINLKKDMSALGQLRLGVYNLHLGGARTHNDARGRQLVLDMRFMNE